MVEPSHRLSLRERLNISRLAIQFPWVTLGFWIAVAVAGVLAFSSLKYALFPDITFPVVVVNASAPLKTALDTERDLTTPIEQSLQTLSRRTGTNSTTYAGQSVIRLRFQVGTNLDESTRQVENTLKQLKLPAGATSKAIPINLNEAAVVSYAVEGTSQTLAQLAQTTNDQILPTITDVPGVLKVNLLGNSRPIEVAQLTNPEQAQQAISQAGTSVQFNGREALAFQVVKRSDANTLEVVQQVEDAVQRLQNQLPTVKLTLATTQADYIRSATQETIQALIEAIVLSVVVIMPFLRSWRATIISALAIPMSLLGTFIVMAIYGFNLETITLLALAMVIGSIIDDAIVDVENIARHLEQGESPKQAAILATNEIGLTVTAATLTAVAVFLPVGLMGGVLGQFFKPFGITISAAMLISLLVARTLSPLLAAYWLRPAKRSETPNPRRDWLAGIDRGYRTLLGWSLRHRGVVVGVAIVSFAVGLALIPLIPKGFIPKLDRGEFNITYTAPLPKIPTDLAAQAQQAAAQLPPGATPPTPPPFDPLADSRKVANELDAFVRRSPDVDTVFTVVGTRQGEPNKGSLYIKLKQQRSTDTAQLQDQFRQQLPKLAGVTTSVEDIQFVDTGGEKPVQVQIVGNDLTALNKAARDIKARLEKIPGIEDPSTTADNNSTTITEINRTGGQRVATISANLGQSLTIGEATDRAVAEAKAVLPAGVSLRLGGDSARVDEILGSFGSTLGLSLLCIVVVLFALFKRWTDTLVIFVSLPLSIVGAMLGLLLTRSDFGMISLIGIIFLLGLTNKNAILIVDYIRQLRRSGKSRTEAILEAGPVRLRPILMTTAATILGMLPLALALGAGAELRAPMAVAIMGGLVTSTLLSLIVVPVIYDLVDDWRSLFKRQRNRV
ncbi:efflux RND transporter permease subunit [Leptolyngbya sp. FACHB-36]|uniref:efflux RND transporter permease subunit n=1 Tax=Leptolyngbya sp. FACHB-36 TaxID=2692808 RepID=UPI001681A489|nr:efflux RND transporter permease subunit [Leptolyngbya sp. FACHB-36]MBD2019078.1 efflux RND transporter permease subunit [Leptolyngbya sp. FACHB-36]